MTSKINTQTETQMSVLIAVQDEGTFTLQEVYLYTYSYGLVQPCFSSMERLSLVISRLYLKLLMFNPRTAKWLFDTKTRILKQPPV